jgi:hypothetical protein
MIENTVAIVAVGHSWTRAIQDHHEQLLPGCSWHHCNTPHTYSVCFDWTIFSQNRSCFDCSLVARQQIVCVGLFGAVNY